MGTPFASAAPEYDRRLIEEELAARARQQSAVADLGLRALAGMDVDALLGEAVAVVAEVLGVDLVGILQALPGEEGRFRFRAGVGWNPGVVGATVPAGPSSAVTFILRSAEPVVIDDIDSEVRFDRAPVLVEHGARSGMGVVIHGPRGPFGILGAHARRRRSFSRDDAAFLQSMANLVGEALERKRAEEAMRAAFEREREAVERLRSLNEMKNAFLEAVSHELRTPLASVLGFALTLHDRRPYLTDDEVTELLGRLAVNARKLDRLLRDLLDLDRLYRRTIRPERRPTDLVALVRATIEQADVAGRSIKVADGDVVVPLDAPKVERIIENLIVNVIRHTSSETSIWVHVRREGDGALLVVEDDGPGIPDALKQAVFDAFRRGPTSQTHSPGAGIGLSLVSRFAQLHGGRAWVEDRPGGGARFCVLLPGSDEERAVVLPP